MTEWGDWVACQQLWHLRRNRPEPRTWPAERLVAEHIGHALTGQPMRDPMPDVKWRAGVDNARTARIAGERAAVIIHDWLVANGAHYSGYHHRDFRAFETASVDAVIWWLIEVNARPSTAAWLEIGDIARTRETATEAGVIHVKPTPGSLDPEVRFHVRPLAPLANLMAPMRWDMDQIVEHGAPADRTPGWHCARCPDRQCPVRAL